MRKNLFERILAGLLPRKRGRAASSSFWRARRRAALAGPSTLLPRGGGGRPAIPAPVCRAESFADSSAFTCSRRARSPDADLFFLAGARRIALDRGQIFVGLRQLIAQRRKLRPAAAAPAGGRLRVTARARADRFAARRAPAVLVCRRSRSGDAFALRARATFCAMRRRARLLRAAGALRASWVSASPAASRSSMAPICLACSSSRPRVRSASRFSSATRARAAVSSASVLIAGFLRARVLLFLAPAPRAERLWKLALRLVQIERELGGFAFQHPESAGHRAAQVRHHLRAQFFVALGLGRLALQRIHLPPDFFQNVEHARKILLGAFELRFRQPLARFVLADAGGFFDDGPAVGRLVGKNLADAALLDDGVALRAQAGAR